MRTSLKKQSGLIGMFLVFIYSVIAFTMIIGMISYFNQEFRSSVDDSKMEYLNESAAKLESWYQTNAGIYDNPALNLILTEDDLFKKANIQKKYGAQILVSNIISYTYPQGGGNLMQVTYHTIIFRLPVFGINDTSTFNVATGAFTPSSPNELYKIIDGKKIEIDNIIKATNMMKKFAQILELRFKSKLEMDPVHDVNYNYFRAADCASPTAEEIPCTNGFVDVNSPVLGNLNEILGDNGVSVTYPGLNFSQYTSPWVINGLPDTLQIDNTSPNANDQNPPYYMALRVMTPWNTPIIVIATEPIN